ncbi:hypothetical protein [Fangia hongkongensis]|uniref:hypothetical protein n=1 Tax=Fangia hongkongensis TaxID=270495 RepID=UPI000381BAAF|nr:hypothetical protein [Fangia hongkongensis]MBK2124426.1 hypothetical protein [Fangia hongkongensis]
MQIYDIPENVDQFFENGITSYSIIDADEVGDNLFSMDLFLDAVGFKEENIKLHDGTMVIVTNGVQTFRINAGGLGDFYSHGYDVTEYTEV